MGGFRNVRAVSPSSSLGVRRYSFDIPPFESRTDRGPESHILRPFPAIDFPRRRRRSAFRKFPHADGGENTGTLNIRRLPENRDAGDNDVRRAFQQFFCVVGVGGLAHRRSPKATTVSAARITSLGNFPPTCSALAMASLCAGLRWVAIPVRKKPHPDQRGESQNSYPPRDKLCQRQGAGEDLAQNDIGDSGCRRDGCHLMARTARSPSSGARPPGLTS